MLNHVVSAAGPTEQWGSALTDWIEEAFKHLMARGSFLRPDHVEQLLGMFEKHAPPVKRQEAEVCDRALCLLSLNAFGTGDADLASRVIDLNETTGDSYWTAYLFAMIARAPSGWSKARPRLVGAALSHFPEDQDLLGELVGHENIRQDPECRRHFLRCCCPAVLVALAKDGREDEFCDLFRRLAAIDAKQALLLLEETPDLTRRMLSRIDLPLLHASSSEVRPRVIAMLDEFFEKPESEDRALRGLFS